MSSVFTRPLAATGEPEREAIPILTSHQAITPNLFPGHLHTIRDQRDLGSPLEFLADFEQPEEEEREQEWNAKKRKSFHNNKIFLILHFGI